MKGKITRWKDNRSFGFIVPDAGGEEIFFHISSVKNQARRPRIGDVVLYDSTRDDQGRLKAKGVVIEGIKSKAGTSRNKSVIHTEPIKKGLVDYVSILVVVMTLVFGIHDLYKIGNIANPIPFGVLLLVAVVMLNIQKKPKEEYFTCARCNKTKHHSKRTIRAWNQAFTKLYCGSCHKRWIEEKDEPQVYVSGGRGCLGVAIILILLPIAIGYGVYEWLI